MLKLKNLDAFKAMDRASMKKIVGGGEASFNVGIDVLMVACDGTCLHHTDYTTHTTAGDKTDTFTYTTED